MRRIVLAALVLAVLVLAGIAGAAMTPSHAWLIQKRASAAGGTVLIVAPNTHLIVAPSTIFVTH